MKLLLLIASFTLQVTSLPVQSSPCIHNVTKTENIWNCSSTFPLEFPLPNTVPPGVVTYDLSNNQLLEIHRINSSCSSITTCKGCVRNLLLHHNQIDTIVNHAFINLHCLHTLDLSYNNIKGDALSEVTFQGLLQLEVLSLKGNPLGHLKDFTLMFNELKVLRAVDLSDCQLTHIGDHAFDDLPLLESIDLSGNQLKSVDPIIFNGLHFVDILDLSKNVLSYIHSKNFFPLLRLQKLYLDHNNLTTIPDDGFKGLGNLEILSISENQFTEIPYNAMEEIQGLVMLNFSRNPFVNLEASNWPKDKKLGIKELYMDEMGDEFTDIQYRAFSAMPLLRNISISGNKNLVSIAHNAFGGSSEHLKRMSLVDNGLEYLSPHLLPWTDLESLELDGNPWKCDCKLRWMLEGSDFSLQNTSVRCSTPKRLHNKNLSHLTIHDLHCPNKAVWITVIVIISVLVIIVVGVVVVEWKFRDKLPWHRSKDTMSLFSVIPDEDVTFKVKANETELFEI